MCGLFVVTLVCFVILFFFFIKQKTAYEMCISDWSSDVCSSDLFIIVFLFLKFYHFNVFIKTYVLTKNKLCRRFRDRHGRNLFSARVMKIGRASCRERVCQYV